VSLDCAPRPVNVRKEPAAGQRRLAWPGSSTWSRQPGVKPAVVEAAFPSSGTSRRATGARGPGQVPRLQRRGRACRRSGCAEILHALGFAAELDGDTWRLGVPPHRSANDISIPDDIVEEVLRVHGYDNVTPRLPACPIDPVPANVPLTLEHRARRLLAVAHGFVEVHTYSWFDDTWLDRLGFEPGPTPAAEEPDRPAPGAPADDPGPQPARPGGAQPTHAERFRLFELGQASRPRAEGREQLTLLTGVSYTPAGRRASRTTPARFGAPSTTWPRPSAPAGSPTPSRERAVPPWQDSGHWLEVRRDGQLVGALGVLPATRSPRWPRSARWCGSSST